MTSKTVCTLLGLLSFAPCSFASLPTDFSAPPIYARWDFTDGLDGWRYGHQDTNPDHQCQAVDGVVLIWTRAGSVDRKKIHTDRRYTSGRYSWRTYVPAMGVGDQSSVGCWIYANDNHEIDFEIGYGKHSVRQELGAEADDLVAYMTTQDHPFASMPVLIKSGWHVFELDLSVDQDGVYWVRWIIDGEVRSVVQQTYGPKVRFRIFCSVENLKFIGDKPSSQDNYGLFDWVEYTFHP